MDNALEMPLLSGFKEILLECFSFQPWRNIRRNLLLSFFEDQLELYCTFRLLHISTYVLIGMLGTGQ